MGFKDFGPSLLTEDFIFFVVNPEFSQHNHVDSFYWLTYLPKFLLYLTISSTWSQLMKMVEAFENYMISDVRKLIVRQIDVVIKERNREEGNLPLDLWKKPVRWNVVGNANIK